MTDWLCPLSLPLFHTHLSLCTLTQVHNEFILPSEQEGFIHRMGDIISRAEALMKKGALGSADALGGLRLPYLSGAGTLSASQVGHCLLNPKLALCSESPVLFWSYLCLILVLFQSLSVLSGKLLCPLRLLTILHIYMFISLFIHKYLFCKCITEANRCFHVCFCVNFKRIFVKLLIVKSSHTH